LKGQYFNEARQHEKRSTNTKVRKIIVSVSVCLLFQRKNRAKGSAANVVLMNYEELAMY
jgi:hypothetical protein